MSWKPPKKVQKSSRKLTKRVMAIREALVDRKTPASNVFTEGNHKEIHKAITADPNSSLDVIVASGLRPSDFGYRK